MREISIVRERATATLAYTAITIVVVAQHHGGHCSHVPATRKRQTYIEGEKKKRKICITFCLWNSLWSWLLFSDEVDAGIAPAKGADEAVLQPDSLRTCPREANVRSQYTEHTLRQGREAYLLAEWRSKTWSDAGMSSVHHSSSAPARLPCAMLHSRHPFSMITIDNHW